MIHKMNLLDCALCPKVFGMTTNIGKSMKHLRSNLGLSQEQVAFKLGISAAYLSRVENGKIKPRQDWACMVFDALGEIIAERAQTTK